MAFSRRLPRSIREIQELSSRMTGTSTYRGKLLQDRVILGGRWLVGWRQEAVMLLAVLGENMHKRRAVICEHLHMSPNTIDRVREDGPDSLFDRVTTSKQHRRAGESAPLGTVPRA